MADNINNIIDVSGAQSDFAAVFALIDKLEAQIAAANAQSLKVEIDAKNLQSLNEIIEATTQLKQAKAALAQVEEQNTIITKEANTQQEKLTAALNGRIEAIKKLQSQTAKGSEEWNNYERSINSVQKAIDRTTTPFQKLTAAVKETGNKVEETGKKFTIMGVNVDSVITRMIVRMVAFQLLLEPITQGVTALWQEFTKLTNAQQAAKDATEDLQSALQQMAKNTVQGQQNIFSGTVFDQNRALLALNVANDITASITQRVNAYQDLQNIIPGVLNSLTKEQEKNGKFLADAEKVNAAIKASNELKQATNDLKIANDANAVLQSANQKLRATGATVDASGFIKPATGGSPNLTDAESKALLNQKEIIQQLDKAQGDYNTSYKEFLKLRVLDEKTHPERDAKKEMLAEIKLEQEKFKLQQTQNQKEYDLSRRTFEDARDLENAQEFAAENHYSKLEAIIKKYHGRVGEGEAEFKARLTEAFADEQKARNEAVEALKKIDDEIAKRHQQADKEADEYIQKLRKQREEITQLIADLDLQKKNNAEDRKGRSFFSYLFGTDEDNTREIRQLQNTRDAAVEAHSKAINELNEQQHPNNGASPDLILINDALEKEITARANAEQSETDLAIAQSKLREDAKKKEADLTIQLAQTVAQTIKTIQDNQFAREQQQLQIQQQELELQSKQKIDAINATAGFQITKQNEVAKVTAETTAAENALQAKQNQLQLKKAIADKQAAEASVIANTASAIMKTIAAYAPLIGGIAIAAPIIALEAAIGAAQYAAVASTPLPQFFLGGKTTTSVFSAAERGRELAVTPKGEMVMLDKPGAYSAPIGTEIIANKETERLLRYGINSMGVMERYEPIANAMTDKNIVEELRETRDAIVSVGLAQARRRPDRVIVVNQQNYLQRPKR